MKSDKKIAIMVTAIMVISVFAFVMPVSAQWPEPVELWSYPTNVVDIAIGDLNGDGKDDVAAIDIGGGTVHAISGPDGTPLWDNESVGGLAIDVGDIDGNPGNEVIAGGYNSDFGTAGITAYDSDGNFLWFYPTEVTEGEEIIFDIEIGDIDGDDIGDVVACSPESFPFLTIYAVDGDRNALPGWPVEFPAWSVAVGDLDGEPGMEVAAMGEFGLAVLNGSGGVMWWFNETEGIPVEIGDVDGDGDNEVVIGIGGGVLAFNGTNADHPDNPDPIYGFETGDVVTNIELGDLDGIPGDEVVSMGIGGVGSLYAIDIDAPEGEREMWSYEELNWFVREGIAIGDIDGDNKNEVVAGFVFEGDGEFPEFGVAAFDGVDGDVIWLYETETPLIDVEVGDLDGDGDDDVVIGTGGPFTIHALATRERVEVPALTPIGIVALVGLLAIVATSTILRNRKKER